MQFFQIRQMKIYLQYTYTNLETTVCYRASCVTPVPEIVVIITRFSDKNFSSFLFVKVSYFESMHLNFYLKILKFEKILNFGVKKVIFPFFFFQQFFQQYRFITFLTSKYIH